MHIFFVRMAAILAIALVAATLPGTTPPAEAAHPVTFRVTITNTTDPEQILSPGAWLVHTEAGALWARDGMTSPELELIAEIGEPSAVVAALGAGEIGPAPAKGASVTFEVTAEPGDLLSTVQMLVATNDGFVGLQSVALFDGETALTQTIELNAYDAGTEENTGLHQGFEGGQPDPSRGAENIENGTPTAEPISRLDLVSGAQATATIEALEAMDGPDTGNAGLLTGSGGPAAWQWAALIAVIGIVAAAAAHTRRRTA